MRQNEDPADDENEKENRCSSSSESESSCRNQARTRTPDEAMVEGWLSQIVGEHCPPDMVSWRTQ